jgi:predicted Fe-Mo cluster-binding NifX family protein
MKVAVTVWEGTVSTVCDFSSRLLVFDVMGDEVKNRSFIPFETGILPERVNQLGELGVEVLLCGAISRPLERMIRASGVKVIPCLRGAIEEVIGAYLDGGLSDARFTLPGFGPGASRVRGRKRWHGGGFCQLPDKVKGNGGGGRG